MIKSMDDTGRDEEGVRVAAQQQRSSIPSFLFAMVILFILTNHNGEEFLARHQYQDGLRSLSWQLANFTAWMNGTSSNFTLPERDTTVAPLVYSIIPHGEILNPLRSSYYSNITGFHHGDSQLFNISEVALPELNSSLPWKSAATTFMSRANGTNMTETLDRIGTWNWAASDTVSLSLVEKTPPSAANISSNIVLIHGRMEFTDSETSEDLKLEFEAVHFVSNGSLYGFAEPTGRNIDIRLLPSLVPEEAQNQTAKIIEPELVARINKLANLIDAGVIEEDSLLLGEKPATTCPFIVHGQLTQTGISEQSMQELESEMQTPTGLSTAKTPKLSMDVVLVSRECGILIQILKTEGLRSTSFFRKVTNYSGMAAMFYLALVVLLIRQLALSRTPSGISRVSRWTFFIQSTLDSVSFAGHVTFAILSEGKPSVSLVAPAFLASILFFYEAQFSVLIFQVQAPEDSAPPPQPAPAPISNPSTQDMPNASPTPTPTNPTRTTQQPQTLPTPATQPTPAQPQTTSFWRFFLHHLRTDPQARLWMVFFLFMTLVVRVIMSPTMSLIFVGATYSSIWLPQIVRSAKKGRSSGLSMEYVVGTTACRLFFILYFLGCPGNVLDVKPRPWIFLLGIFVSLQAVVVLLQDFFGPNFFLPSRYASVKTYDYHPILPLPTPEAPEQSLGDCSICMDAINIHGDGRGWSATIDQSEKVEKDWDAKASGTPATPSLGDMKRNVVGSTTGGLLNAVQMGVGRKSYSLAPCHHLFHTECLERWLEIKNICPQCRRPLPPL